MSAVKGSSAFDAIASDITTQLQELCRRTDITPLLDALNEAADKHRQFAVELVDLIIRNINAQRIPNKRLALFFLLDTFSKNRRISAVYRPLIAANITTPFLQTYRSATDNITKTQLYKMLTAWKTYAIFDAALVTNILTSITPPPDKSKSASADPRKRGHDAADEQSTKRAKPDGAVYRQPTASAAPSDIDNVLNVLEQSLRVHPELLPTLYELRSLVRRPGGSDIAVAGPKIEELTAALQAAVARQSAQQPQPPPQQLLPQQSAYAPAYYAPPAQVYQQQQPMSIPQPTTMPQPQMGYNNFQQYPMQSNLPQMPIQLPQQLHPQAHPQQYQHHHNIRQQQAGQHRRNGQRDGGPVSLHSLSFNSRAVAPAAPTVPMTFELSRLKVLDEAVVASLYDAIPFQCKTCGLRLFDSDSMGAHLDWHFAVNRRNAKLAKQTASKSASQQYYATLQEWVDVKDLTLGAAVRIEEDDKANESDDSNSSDDESALNALNCPADDEYKVCPICSDPFDLFWSDDEESWMYRGAKRIAIDPNDERAPDGETDDERAARLKRLQVQRQYLGHILHHTCYHSVISGSRIATAPTTATGDTTTEESTNNKSEGPDEPKAEIKDELPPPLEKSPSH